ncbi:MAG: thioredoxin [Thermoplasmata archaeon]
MHEDDELAAIRQKKIAEIKEKLASRENQISEPVELTDSDFALFVKKYPNVVVDFWAPWCGPCRAFAPVFHRAAKEHAGKIVFGKVNVDENEATAEKYGITGVPTIIAFKNGKEIERFVGAMPYSDFLNALRSVYGE